MAEILVVDNNSNITLLLNEVLSRDGHQVTTIVNGLEALNLIYKKEFDIAFIDLVLPGISGLHLLKSLKKQSPQTVMIVMSGRNDFNSAIDSIRLGAYDYLRKPFDIDDILEITKSAFAERKQMLDTGYAYKHEPYKVKRSKTENILKITTNTFMALLALFIGFALQLSIFQGQKIPLAWGSSEFVYLLASFVCCYGFIIAKNHKNSRYFIRKLKFGADIVDLTSAYILFVAILFFLKKIYFVDLRLALMFGYVIGLTGLRLNRSILVPWLAGYFMRRQEGQKSIVVIGTGKKAEELARHIQKRFGRNNVVNITSNNFSLNKEEEFSASKNGRYEENSHYAPEPEELYLDGNALGKKQINNLITDFNGRRVTINLTGKRQKKSGTLKLSLP